jgi:Sap, sulfolipid-1-addressing protein
MVHIIGLAFASAGSLALQLLAVVLVILTRPRPKPLLWAFWLSALVVSCGFGFLALALFRAKGTLLGTTSRNVSPAIYLIVGVVAVCVAAFAATRRGRELIGREIDKRQKEPSPNPHGSVSERAQVKVESVKAKAEEALQRGSVWVALAVGLLLGAPTPFQLAATGIMVRNGYGLVTQSLLVAAFSLVTYIVVEIPIVSYAVWPDATSNKVTAFSDWLGTHKIQAAAAVAGVVGLVLIGKGIAAL